MSQEDVLIHNVSPSGNVEAIVQQDGRSIYMYLRGSDDLKGFGLRPVWVRNLLPAPETFSREDAANGVPPLLPKRFCAHPEGGELPDGRNLRIVWLEECDSAALTEMGEILAIVPGWSGEEGFHGYARDCNGDTPVAWALPANTAADSIVARVEQAREYWSDWDSDRVWTPFQKEALGSIEQEFGEVSEYFSIDGKKWPPRFMVQVDGAETTWLLTGGMCLRPMPRVEMYVSQFKESRRIELGAAVPHADKHLVDVYQRWMAGLSGLPWDNCTWLGDGHTVPVPATESSAGTFSKIRFQFSDEPRFALPAFRGDPVRRLWMTPDFT